MALGVHIKVDAKEVMSRLARAGAIMDDQKILAAIGNRLLKWINDNFKQQGIEQRWPPLSENTIAGRRKKSSVPLQDTGRLRQSFVTIHGPNYVEVGTVDERAEALSEGTPPHTIYPVRAKALSFMTANGRVTVKRVDHPGIPPRPMIPSEGLAEKIVTDAVEGFVRNIQKVMDRGKS